MEIQKVKNASHPFFDDFWKVYNENFPKEEKRNLLQQAETFTKPEYSLNLYIEDHTLKGFLAYWIFPSFIFIEHLAIAKSGQGQGLGKIILTRFIEQQEVPIILEIEHPEDETSIRRLRFYERLNFIKNKHRHTQPPFIKGGEPLSLTILSYPEIISEDLYLDFSNKQQNIVMNHQN